MQLAVHPIVPYRTYCLPLATDEYASNATMMRFIRIKDKQVGINSPSTLPILEQMMCAIYRTCFFWRLIFAQRFFCAAAIASRPSGLSVRFNCFGLLFLLCCLLSFGSAAATANERTRVSKAIAASSSLIRFPLGLRPAFSSTMASFSFLQGGMYHSHQDSSMYLCGLR